MLLQTQVLLLTAAIVVSSVATASVSLPGCSSKCGNIDVPYPFGLTPNCSLDEGFQLSCFGSRLFSNVNLELETIYLSSGRARAYGSMFLECDRGASVNPNWPQQIDLTSSPYSLSRTENKFTAIGCGTLAQLNATSSSNASSASLAAGCLSVCYNETTGNFINGVCSGAGCCQTTIPSSITYFTVTFSPLGFRPRDNLCRYAFLAEQNWYSFSESDLHHVNFTNKIPIVLNWSIAGLKCNEAKYNLTSYACKSKNSICVETPSKGGFGYYCNCEQGYRGNPYLTNGCQEVDMCADVERPGCYYQCTNLPYKCTCPEGKIGDPHRPGGCVSPLNRARTIIITSIGIGGGSFLLLVTTMVLWRILKDRSVRKRKQKCFQRNLELLRKEQSSSDANLIERMKIYDLDELEKATNNFDKTRIIGGGGHGHVYKGILSDQRVVAIKRPRITNQAELGQFINEVFILSQTNHRNVVTFFGCCLQTEVPLLVFEFISGGTLCDHLIDNQNYSPLSFEDRLRIATEVARALHYLHSEASITIFHRDIKSSNILLDERNTAKLADFGASRSVPLERTSITTVVQGTYGYLDPEYHQTGRLTEKSDVYSFGVIMVELLTGRIAIPYQQNNVSKYLIMEFLVSLKEKSFFKILDPQVLKEGTEEKIEIFARLAQICLRLNGSERPTMKEVVDKLEAMRKKRLKGGDVNPWLNREDISLGGTTPFEPSASSRMKQYYSQINLLGPDGGSRDFGSGLWENMSNLGGTSLSEASGTRSIRQHSEGELALLGEWPR